MLSSNKKSNYLTSWIFVFMRGVKSLHFKFAIAICKRSNSYD